MAREYYLQRHSENWVPPRLSLKKLREICEGAYREIDEWGFLDYQFGTDENGDFYPGQRPEGLHIILSVEAGVDIEGWLGTAISGLDEKPLFAVLEFVFDHVAQKSWVNGNFVDVDVEFARTKWRELLNPYLKLYGPGFELTAQGVVSHLPEAGLEEVYGKPAPPSEEAGNVEKVARALALFRSAKSGRTQKQEAVRHLADVMEWYQKSTPRGDYGNGDGVKGKDEAVTRIGDFVQHFRIRHNGPEQVSDYPDALLDLFFHQALAFIHFYWATRHEKTEERARSAVPEALRADLSKLRDDIEQTLAAYDEESKA